MSIYTGVGGGGGPYPLSVQQTVSIHGGTVDVVQAAGGTTSTSSGSLAIDSGTATATFTRACPSAQPPSSEHYSASAGTLTLFLENGAQTITYTYGA